MTNDLPCQVQAAVIDITIKSIICVLIIYFSYSFEYLGLTKFYNFQIRQQSVRLISAVLLHKTTFGKLLYSIKLLTYLKRTKKKHSRMKCFNLILVALKVLFPIIPTVCLIINIGQENSIPMIVKNFVALAFIMSIETMFVGLLPADAEKLID